MQLIPKLPPGRSTRKLREYGPQIRNLRSQGYTFEAIRLALAEAGVMVDRATVFREATRQRAELATRPAAPVAANVSLPTAPPSPDPASPPTPPPTAPPAPLPALNVEARLSGRDIAEAFARGHIDNPLLRKDRQ